MIINVSKLKKYTNITDAIIDYAKEINNNFQTNIVINTKKNNSIDYSKKYKQLFIINQNKNLVK